MPIPKNYTKAVVARRKELLRGRSIRKVAAEMNTADSQIVRLLNGRARRASHILVRDVAQALGYGSTDAFYAKLEELWKSMDRAAETAKLAKAA